MTRLHTLLLGTALTLGMGGAALADSAEKLVTIVTSADAQTQLMAMVLTAQAVEQGAQTRILLCGPGGDLALKDAPATATTGQPPRGASPQGLMQAMMGNGVAVEVCAIYLPGKGADATVLIDGVGVAQPPAMAAAMRDTATSVWSF